MAGDLLDKSIRSNTMKTDNGLKFKIRRVKEFSDWVDTLEPIKLAIVLEREKNMEKGTFGD